MKVLVITAVESRNFDHSKIPSTKIQQEYLDKIVYLEILNSLTVRFSILAAFQFDRSISVTNRQNEFHAGVNLRRGRRRQRRRLAVTFGDLFRENADPTNEADLRRALHIVGNLIPDSERGGRKALCDRHGFEL